RVAAGHEVHRSIAALVRQGRIRGRLISGRPGAAGVKPTPPQWSCRARPRPPAGSGAPDPIALALPYRVGADTVRLVPTAPPRNRRTRFVVGPIDHGSGD